MPESAELQDGPGDPVVPRRGFLKKLSVLLGGLVATMLGAPMVRYLLFPVRVRVVEGGDDPLPIASDGSVVAGGPPVRAEIVAREGRDAWAKLGEVRLGACWLVRYPDGKLRALSTSCPHLGCAVDFDAATQKFRCPCHESSFDLEGARVSGPAKRGLDPFELDVEEGQIRVRFQRFAPDTADREPV